MKYKDKGIDFCTEFGCLEQAYGGEVDGLRFCPEHFADLPDVLSEEKLAHYHRNCKDVNASH